MEEKKEIGFFEEEILEMQSEILEKALSNKEMKKIDKDILEKVMNFCFENILKEYKLNRRENGALVYLKELYDSKKISERLYNKFLEYEEFRRIKQRKKFNTVRMVDFILKSQFKINFDDYSLGLPKKIEKHIEMCIDVTIGKNYMGVRKEYVKDNEVMAELNNSKNENEFKNIVVDF